MAWPVTAGHTHQPTNAPVTIAKIAISIARKIVGIEMTVT
jgi:hypothetical protein